MKKVSKNHLKIKVDFDMDYNPEVYLNSILDITPSCIQELKERLEEEKIKKYSKNKLKFEYSSDFLISQKKKKKAKKDPEEDDDKDSHYSSQNSIDSG
jgi:hypothetical protein